MGKIMGKIKNMPWMDYFGTFIETQIMHYA